jgi:hypothetical protein
MVKKINVHRIQKLNQLSDPVSNFEVCYFLIICFLMFVIWNF